jgi:hypothetical protein
MLDRITETFGSTVPKRSLKDRWARLMRPAK